MWSINLINVFLYSSTDLFCVCQYFLWQTPSLNHVFPKSAAFPQQMAVWPFTGISNSSPGEPEFLQVSRAPFYTWSRDLHLDCIRIRFSSIACTLCIQLCLWLAGLKSDFCFSPTTQNPDNPLPVLYRPPLGFNGEATYVLLWGKSYIGWRYTLGGFLVVVCVLENLTHLDLCNIGLDCVSDHLLKWFRQSDLSLFSSAFTPAFFMWVILIRIYSRWSRCENWPGVSGANGFFIHQQPI